MSRSGFPNASDVEPTLSRASRMAGRREERRRIAAALDGATEGSPCAFLVHGEAGVGKTRLVQEMCDRARRNGFTILWGRCVRFDAIEAPYHPLLQALNVWAEDADAEDRARVLAGAVDLEEFSSRSRDWLPTGSGRLFAAIDEVIAAIAAQAPTVLVMDDLQWADLSSRDALAYLIAGFHRQRLAVLVTYRDEALRNGDSLHGWLADARRLPAVHNVALPRLDNDETKEQLHLLMGRAPQATLVADVMNRSSGNPYLSELLVQGIEAGAERLPTGVPDALSEALLSAWHALSEPARTVLGILSVAGRPATCADLAGVAKWRVIDPSVCAVAIRQASDQGIVVQDTNSLVWFRHPLLAELIYGTLLPSELGPIHLSWARKLEFEVRTGVDEVRRQGDLARHYEEGGDLTRSLTASLRAAELAEGMKAVREVALHLQRAVRLWPLVHDDSEGRQPEGELLERAARASRRIGDGEFTLAAWSRALLLVDEETDPLRASRVLSEYSETAWQLGLQDDNPTPEMTRALQLSKDSPDSSEYAEALTALSQCEFWLSGQSEQAMRHAEEAVAAAQRSQSPRALGVAYAAHSYTVVSDERADEDTVMALAYAREAGDNEQVCWAYVARHNVLDARGQMTAATSLALEGFEFARDSGELSMTAFMAGTLAQRLLEMGRFAEAGAVVREGLSRAAVSNSAAGVRLTAALLAVRTGRLEAADLHMERAKELIPAIENRPGLVAPPTMAEYELAKGHPENALELLSRTLAVHAVDPRVADQMLMWGARAAADLAEHCRDLEDLDNLARTQSALQDLVGLRHNLPQMSFERRTANDLVQPAVEAVFNAELARCEAVTATSRLWEEAVRRCEMAEMRWHAETSRLRWAQALAIEGAPRSVVACQVRTGHRFSADTGAKILKAHFEALAVVCGFTLDEAVVVPALATRPRFSSLTQREHEVLAYLVAGRTYRDIASALFISEKTVSTHVSHVLRKTDTSSRREVAALAQRLATDAGPG